MTLYVYSFVGKAARSKQARDEVDQEIADFTAKAERDCKQQENDVRK